MSDDLKRIATLEAALRRLHSAAATAVVVLRGHDEDASCKLYCAVYAARVTLESRPAPVGDTQSLGVASNEQERDGGQSAEGKGERSATVAGATGRGQSDSTADKAASDSGVSDAPSSLPSDPAVEAYYAARDKWLDVGKVTLREMDNPSYAAVATMRACADVLAARVEALRAENARVGRIADQLRSDLETERARYAAMALKHQGAEARALKAERDTEEAREMIRDAAADLGECDSHPSWCSAHSQKPPCPVWEMRQMVASWEATLSEGERKV